MIEVPADNKSYAKILQGSQHNWAYYRNKFGNGKFYFFKDGLRVSP